MKVRECSVLYPELGLKGRFPPNSCHIPCDFTSSLSPVPIQILWSLFPRVPFPFPSQSRFSFFAEHVEIESIPGGNVVLECTAPIVVEETSRIEDDTKAEETEDEVEEEPARKVMGMTEESAIHAELASATVPKERKFQVIP